MKRNIFKINIAIILLIVLFAKISLAAETVDEMIDVIKDSVFSTAFTGTASYAYATR